MGSGSWTTISHHLTDQPLIGGYNIRKTIAIMANHIYVIVKQDNEPGLFSIYQVNITLTMSTEQKHVLLISN